MKSIVEMFNESLVNESHYMDTAMTCQDASDKILKKYKMLITYIGDHPEDTAEKIFDWYGVKSIYVKSENTLLIPCSKEIEKDFCTDEDTCSKKMAEIGLNEMDFEW